MSTFQEPFMVPVQKSTDPRGSLAMVDDGNLPFSIRRVFWLYEVPENSLRGGHAHRSSQQCIVCTHGSIKAELEDLQGHHMKFLLEPNQQGLYVPPLYWGVFNFRNNARAICLASDHFKEQDYIRDYREFRNLQHAHKIS